MTEIPDLSADVRAFLTGRFEQTSSREDYSAYIAARRDFVQLSRDWIDSHKATLCFRDKAPAEIAAMLERWQARHDDAAWPLLCRRLRERGFGVARNWKLDTIAEKIARQQKAMDEGMAALPELRAWIIERHERSHVAGPFGGIGGDHFSRFWKEMHEAFPGNTFPVPRAMGWGACPKDEAIADFDAWAFDHGYDFQETHEPEIAARVPQTESPLHSHHMPHIQLTDELRALLERCTFDGNLVKMPPLDRADYVKVNKILNNAGGYWDRKAGGHVFQSDPRAKLGLVIETGRSLDEKKLYQAFYTPGDVARRILQGVSFTGKRVLEPSAGGGAFANLLRLDADEVVCVELNPEAAAGLRANGHRVIEGDFLLQSVEDLGGSFDVIVMNPPFSRDQDIAHVRHAFSMLKPGGELVAIVSPRYTFAETRACTEFRDWLREMDASEDELAEGTFQESGTPIRTMILAITKPAELSPAERGVEFRVPIFAQAPERGGWTDSGTFDDEARIIWVRGEERALYNTTDDTMIPLDPTPEAAPQGQKLDGIDLQDVLDSAGNADRLGRQQFFTPLEQARAFCAPLPPISARRTFVDFHMGGAALLLASDARRLLGCDIDRRCARKPDKAAGEWDCVAADFTKFFGLLAELNWQYDLGGFNPPFSLEWDTDRFAALAESEVPAVREVYKPGRKSIDSTLATMLCGLDRLTRHGEFYLICNEATAIRLLGDPDDDNPQRLPGHGQALPLRKHVWLWLTVPPGLFEGVRDFHTAVLYFARAEQSGTPLHLTAPAADAASIELTLRTACRQRGIIRKGPGVWTEDLASRTTHSLWEAAAAEWRRLQAQPRPGAHPSNEFNLWLNEDGTIGRHLTPFQHFSGKIPKDDAAALNDLHGKTPMSLTAQKPTRTALLRAVRSTYWRVQPELLAAVDRACMEYAAERAPLYPLSETQRIGFLDEEDSIVCKADFWSPDPALRKKAIGFTAGQSYPLQTQTRKIETPHVRPNILGKEESCTLHGQELVIRIQDNAKQWWEFASFTPEELAGTSAPIAGEKRTPHQFKRHLSELPQYFTIPEVRDVAQLHPERYAANLAALRALEARLNARAAGRTDRAGHHHDAPARLHATTIGQTPSIPGTEEQPLKKGIGFSYRQYQIDDLARFCLHDGGVFAWDKGLGKTVALFSFAIIKGARRTLIVAPEALHAQIIAEAHNIFGLTVKPLLSQSDFYSDAELTRANLDRLNGRETDVTGLWITSYTALGYNGGDEWLGKEDDEGDYIVSAKMKLNRQRDPLWRSDADEKGIGEVRGKDHPIRCLYLPSLATLVADLFDCVGCDEAVRLKSNDSYISLGVRALRPRFRIVLTGTPIKNHLDDIFWLAHWGAGGHALPTARWPYGNSNAEKEEFANAHMFIERNHTREAEAAAVGKRRKFERRIPQICNVHRLWKLLAPAVLCRRKQDIGEALVPKTIIPLRVRPGKAQNAVYRFHVENKPDFNKAGGPMNPVAQIVAQLQNLRQAALCPHSQNLSSAHIRLHKVREILQEEARQQEHWRKAAATSRDPDEREFAASMTTKAMAVARKGESLRSMGPNYEHEADTCMRLVERMIAGSIPIDLDAIFKAAPNLTEKLRPAVVIETNTKSSRSWTDHNPKMAAILKLAEDLIGKGEQLVVMSPFTAFSEALYQRLTQAGVAVCLLDGGKTPALRGMLAAQFKQRKFSVLIGGQKSMGEGHSFECASHLVLPSLDWAFDTNSQCEDRVHRLTSRKPVSIYVMVTENTIDERLVNLYAEKGDSASLALFAELTQADQGEINLGQLLADAIRNFDPHAETIDEQDIEKEWDTHLKARLRAAQNRYNQWHPPITRAKDGTLVTPGEVKRAVALLGTAAKPMHPVVAIVKGIKDATFGALLGTTDACQIAKARHEFTEFCARGEHTDWRNAWRAFTARRQLTRFTRAPVSQPTHRVLRRAQTILATL